MATTAEIEKMIIRCSLGEQKAFTELYKATSAKLFGILLRVLDNRADAEEALQEVYIKIWNNASRFAVRNQSPMSWLIVIARNHAIDMLRARKPIAVEIEEAFEVEDEKKNPEEQALNTSEGRKIERCLSELDDKKAKAVRQAYIEGYSYNELASLFEVPINTMRTWLRRSLASLKECLER